MGARSENQSGLASVARHEVRRAPGIPPAAQGGPPAGRSVGMPRLRLVRGESGPPPARDVLPFPSAEDPAIGLPGAPGEDAAQAATDGADHEPEALAALNEVSRRMNDLARALGCPGYFDDENDDRPTAA